MKPETEIRNMKRELKEAIENKELYRRTATDYGRQIIALKQEVAEWKARFDALLQRTPKVEP